MIINWKKLRLFKLVVTTNRDIKVTVDATTLNYDFLGHSKTPCPNLCQIIREKRGSDPYELSRIVYLFFGIIFIMTVPLFH